MGPPGPRDALRAAIAATGCTVRPGGGGWDAVDCPDALSRARQVDIGAWMDARYDGAIRRLALELLPAGELSDVAIAAAVQRAVSSRVRYWGEAGDLIQAARTTWTYAIGDCDCQARLVCALLRSLGVRVAVVGFGRGETIAHVCAALERPEGLLYLETTLGPAVACGEHPYAAARRLRATRQDLT